MNKDEADTELVIERYLRNELSAPDSENFEQRLLYDEEMQDQFVLAQRLRDGMDLVASGAGEPAPSGWSGLFHSPRYAVAASVLLVVTAFGWLTTWLSVEPEIGTASVQLASGRVYSIESMRGAPNIDNLVQVRPGVADESITLLVYPGLETYPAFSVELARQQDDQWVVVWRGVPTAVGNGDTVAVTLRSDLFAPGIHRLSVIGWEDSTSSELASQDFFHVPLE